MSTNPVRTPGSLGALVSGIVMVSTGTLSMVAGIVAMALREGMKAELDRNPGMFFGSHDGLRRLEAEIDRYQTYGFTGLGLGFVLLVGAFIVVGFMGAPRDLPEESPQARPKSRVIAGVFQAIFAPLGIGRHYLGYHALGIAQLVTCWFTVGFGVVWPLVDALLILSGRVPDKHGKPLR